MPALLNKTPHFILQSFDTVLKGDGTRVYLRSVSALDISSNLSTAQEASIADRIGIFLVLIDRCLRFLEFLAIDCHYCVGRCGVESLAVNFVDTEHLRVALCMLSHTADDSITEVLDVGSVKVSHAGVQRD
ncbi:hypothetical protein PC120_g19702 [Phytophthora cactorum]|nr:hypothetical protein PC120_g19702 [Phytophthora cactorum]